MAVAQHIELQHQSKTKIEKEDDVLQESYSHFLRRAYIHHCPPHVQSCTFQSQYDFIEVGGLHYRTRGEQQGSLLAIYLFWGFMYTTIKGCFEKFTHALGKFMPKSCIL